MNDLNIPQGLNLALPPLVNEAFMEEEFEGVRNIVREGIDFAVADDMFGMKQQVNERIDELADQILPYCLDPSKETITATLPCGAPIVNRSLDNCVPKTVKKVSKQCTGKFIDKAIQGPLHKLGDSCVNVTQQCTKKSTQKAVSFWQRSSNYINSFFV